MHQHHRLAASAFKRFNAARHHQQQSRRGYKSLAFTTYFQQPSLGVNDYEFLSRSTASLLAVDPPDLVTTKDGPYAHLDVSEQRRKIRDFKKKHGYTPAFGGSGTVAEMGWLEFVPREHRPQLHVVCSSHVVSPFLWLDYYPHDWLTQVRQEHWCVWKYNKLMFSVAGRQAEYNSMVSGFEESTHLLSNLDSSLWNLVHKQSSLSYSILSVL